MLNDLDEGHERVSDANHRPTVDRSAGWDNRRRGAAGVPGREVPVIFHKGDVARLGIRERAGGGDQLIAIAQDFAPDPLGEFSDGDGHGEPLLPCEARTPVSGSAEGSEFALSGARPTRWRLIVVYRPLAVSGIAGKERGREEWPDDADYFGVRPTEVANWSGVSG